MPVKQLRQGEHQKHRVVGSDSIRSYEDNINELAHQKDVLAEPSDDLAYEYYQGYNPYSYNIAGKPFLTLYNSLEDTCSVASAYQRQFVVDTECVKSTARTSSGQLDYSVSIQCATTSPFSTWSAIIFDSSDCGASPVARVNGDGPCTCMPFTVGGQSFDMKVNCGGIVFFPCNAYFDDAYYYGTSSSISLYAQIYGENQCPSSSLVPMTATVGTSNRTVVGTDGLTVQNGHCVTATFDQQHNTSLGFYLECKEPTTTSKWVVNVYHNCSTLAMHQSPLTVLKGSNPCDCKNGEVEGIPFSLSINCAGSKSFTCASSMSATSTSLLRADHIAGIVVGSVVILAFLMALLYPIVYAYVLSDQQLLLSEMDESQSSSSHQLTRPSTAAVTRKSTAHLAADTSSRESDVAIPRESELTIVTNPLATGNQTIESMDIYANFYEKERQQQALRQENPLASEEDHASTFEDV